mgnify:CR=1 FL=1
MRRSDTLAAIIALVSAVVCYFEDQIFFGIEIDSDGNIIKQSNESNSVVTSLRLVLIALSFVLCKFSMLKVEKLMFFWNHCIGILVYLHYHFTLKMLKIKKQRLETGNKMARY